MGCSLLRCEFSLLALSGHRDLSGECPLRGKADTAGKVDMAAEPVQPDSLAFPEELVSGLDLGPVGLRLPDQPDEFLVIGFCGGAIAEFLCGLCRPGVAAEAVRLLGFGRFKG